MPQSIIGVIDTWVIEAKNLYPPFILYNVLIGTKTNPIGYKLLVIGESYFNGDVTITGELSAVIAGVKVIEKSNDVEYNIIFCSNAGNVVPLYLNTNLNYNPSSNTLTCNGTITSTTMNCTTINATLVDAGTGDFVTLTAVSIAGSCLGCTNIPTNQLTTAVLNSQLEHDGILLGNVDITLGATTTVLTGMSTITSTTMNGTTINATLVDAGTGDFVTLTAVSIAGSCFGCTNIPTNQLTTAVLNSQLEHDGILLGNVDITLGGTATTVLTGMTSMATGALTISDGIISDSSGQISFSSNNLTTTGHIQAYQFYGRGINLTNIPNSALDNSSITIGTTAISLGASNTTLVGLVSISSTTFTGSAVNLTNIPVNQFSGTIPNNVLTNSDITIGTTAISLGASNTTLVGLVSISSTTFTGSAVNLTNIPVNQFSGTIPNNVLTNSDITIGSTAISLGASNTTLVGLVSVTSGTFTGSAVNLTNIPINQFSGTIPNNVLTNSDITIGTTAISLGASNTTLAGLTSVSSTYFTGDGSNITNVEAGGYVTATYVSGNTTQGRMFIQSNKMMVNSPQGHTIQLNNENYALGSVVFCDYGSQANGSLSSIIIRGRSDGSYALEAGLGCTRGIHTVGSNQFDSNIRCDGKIGINTAGSQDFDVDGLAILGSDDGPTLLLSSGTNYNQTSTNLFKTLISNINTSRPFTLIINDMDTGNNTTKNASIAFGLTDTAGSSKIGPAICAVTDDANCIKMGLEFRTVSVNGGYYLPTSAMKIAHTGMIGMGDATNSTLPYYPLDFATRFAGSSGARSGKVIALYRGSDGNNFYGIGTNSDSTLEIHAGSTLTGHPLMKLKNTAQVGIGLGASAPAATLHVHADSNAGIRLSSSTTAEWSIYSMSSTRIGRLEIQQTLGTDTIPFTIWPDAGSNLIHMRAGEVGIGTDTPTNKLDVNGDCMVRDALFGGLNNGSHNFHIDAESAGAGTRGIYLNYYTGTGVYLAGGTPVSSDKTLKKNIKTLDACLERMCRIRGVSFNWKKENRPTALQLGVIAQEVQKEFPDLVCDDGYGHLAVIYGNFTAPFIECIKELCEQNKAQEERIKQLEDANEEQSKILATLINKMNKLEQKVNAHH